MGLVEQLLTPRPDLGLVHLDRRRGHRIPHPAAVLQHHGDDLPRAVVRQVGERPRDPTIVDMGHQDDRPSGTARGDLLAPPGHHPRIRGHEQAAISIEPVRRDPGVQVMIGHDHAHRNP